VRVNPKQFLPLVRSTFRDAILRVSDVTLFERPIVITNTAYRFLVLEQLAEIGFEADVLLSDAAGFRPGDVSGRNLCASAR
jgi:mannose-1-phosphate guanylyltransferase / mannose-6-phosphate isomerase